MLRYVFSCLTYAIAKVIIQTLNLVMQTSKLNETHGNWLLFDVLDVVMLISVKLKA